MKKDLGFNNVDLTKGNILESLIKLFIPIIGTSFIQTAYNLIDMFFIGKLGSNEVAAVGMAGFYNWFAFMFITFARLGTEIKVATAKGKGDSKKQREYSTNGILLGVLLGASYGLVMILFKEQLISFYGIEDISIKNNAKQYLSILSFSFVFIFSNAVFTGIYNARGNSKVPFIFNSTGLLINIVLDPILIFGFDLGVSGAAYATLTSHIVICSLFLFKTISKQKIFSFKDKFFCYIRKDRIFVIIRLGLLPGIQSGLYTFISMTIAKIAASFSPNAVAVQQIGGQIESITWMTASGLALALSAFTAQNFGAGLYKRVIKGYNKALIISVIIGVSNSLFLIIGREFIINIFLFEKETLSIGSDYLFILGLAQLFMCVELTFSGAFNGLSYTFPPAFISIVFNTLRIPMALLLSREDLFGLNGVWMSLSISSVLKGVIISIWLKVHINRRKEFKSI